jgi:hypothetical protein
MPTDKPPRLHWGWITAFVVLVLGFASLAADGVFHFNDSPLDGPFQLFNGLRRIAAGQRLGGTFQVFHGPGVPYLHFIPFWLFGGDFAASEMSRQLVSSLAAMIVLVAFFRAWTGTMRTAIPMSVVALGLLLSLKIDALLFPINSMIGLRSTMPLFIGIHLLLRPSGRRAMIERAGLFALALMFGIEQGMAAMAGYGLLQVLIALRTRDWREPLRGVGTILLGVGVYAALVFLMTPSGFASVMRFNFKDVPGDQMWYFGGPPNDFFFRWIQLMRLFEHPIWSLMAIIALIYAIARYWMGPAAEDARARVAEAFLMIYAVVSTASMLGTFTTVYFQPAVRVSLFILLLAIRRWWLWRRDMIPMPDETRRRIPAYAALAVLGYAAAGFTLRAIGIVRTPLHIAYAHVWLHEPPVMTPDWQATAQLGDSVWSYERNVLKREPTLWSTYASYIEYRHNVFPASFDYIIHALGHENRELYTRTFLETKPDIVQTLEPTYTSYEEWLAIHHWSFYRPLLRDYQITAAGPWSYFWTRAPQPFDEKPALLAHVAIPPGTLGIAIDGNSVPRDSLGLFEVRLYYHVTNPWKKVPVLGTLPRYIVRVGGATNHIPISLAPYETEKRFPVIAVGARKTFTMLGQVFSIVPGAQLAFDSVHVESLHLSPANRRWARDFIMGPPAFNPDTTSFGPADTVSANRRR